MEKNDIITACAEALGTNGEGIVHVDGHTLFVPYLLPGERARIRVLRVKKSIAYGKAEEIYTPAEERVRPECPVFTRCGGCSLQHIKYRYQLKFKQDLVREALRKLGGLSCEVSPCERSEREYGYRNKLQLPIGRQKGRNVIGFYAERSHRIVPTSVCPIHPAWAKEVISAVGRFMETCGLDGYDEETGTGELRHIVVRELRHRFLVVLVTAVEELKGLDFFIACLDKLFPEYSLYLNYHPEPNNLVLGQSFRLVKGPGLYECTEGGIVYEAGPRTFLQVNAGVRAGLYERVVSLVEEGETVIDCYSGGGLLTAMLAKRCGRAYGIEIVPEASACADRLAQKNGLTERMTNECGAVEELLPRLLERLGGSPTVVLDPPRSGIDRRVIDVLAGSAVKKLIMVSCNPATLARDVGLLVGTLAENEKGELVKCAAPPRYEVELVQPFDMFPQTKWVETLVVLSRKEPDGHM